MGSSAVLAELPHGPDPARGQVDVSRRLAAAGNIAFSMGRYEESLVLADRCRDVALGLDKPAEIAAALALKSKGLHATGQERLALEFARG